MNDIEIIDDIFDVDQYENLKQMIFSETFPWFYGNTSYKNQDETEDLYSFEHLVMDNGKKNSEICNVTDFLLKSRLKKIIKQDFLVFRIRLGMITKENEKFRHVPHVDHPFPHFTGLIYFNDCDADTEIYHEQYDMDSKITIKEYLEQKLNSNVSLDRSVESKENRLVLFDGLKYHSSSTPTDVKRRVVLNFNYVYR